MGDFGGRFLKRRKIVRRDMAKVVTEKPRYGHANRSKKTSLRTRRYNGEDHLDDLPERVASYRSRQHGWDAKEFSDRLGTLKKFLRRQVGRHWDEVYGELSRNLDKRSLTGRHIWIHVWQYVEKDVVIENGKVYQKEAHYGRRYEIKGLYIHPKSCVLCWAGGRV